MTAKNGRGRPIGARVVEAMEILEQMGEASYADVWERMTVRCERENASKYLGRAALYGLATKSGAKPYTRYRAVPGWRTLLEVEQPKPEPYRRPIASVWELGARA